MRCLAVFAVILGFGSAHAESAKRRKIEDAFARGELATKLAKTELRPTMKAIAPKVQRCYAQALVKDAKTGGVVNTRLTVKNDPRTGLILSVNGFDTHGPLGESPEFRACVTKTFEAAVLPPTKTRGTRDFTYPMTFSSEPLSDKDIAIVETAEQEAKGGRWREAFASAERGLELTSLDGPYRRRLIEVAGVAACHLKDTPKARAYFALASPGFEDRIAQACTGTDLQ